MADPGRILVTGADGFVGAFLLPALRAAFPGSLIFACAERDSLPGADGVVPLDLLDPCSIRDCISQSRPDAVLHLAAQANVPQSFADPARTWRINVNGTLTLADALMRTAPGALLVYISSSETYGRTFETGEPLNEDAPFAPANPYAASKAAVDLLLGEMSSRGLNVLRLRPANHTGAGQRETFVVPAFARQIALIEAGRQQPMLNVGALDRWRDFLDVRDICAAYVAALGKGSSLPAGSVLNISSGIPRRIGDILDGLIARSGRAIEVKVDRSRLRPTDILTATCDSSRAQALLGWAPKIDWETSLDDVLADWRTRVAADQA
jgi:GDP-4-dehydro-6-deoxy-D-mannose reductase